MVGLDDATHDIKRVRLRSPQADPFDFSAGQFASVTFEGCPPRDYSMANVPGDPMLEFHVRRTEGGATSAHVAEKLKLGDSVRVEGPFGASYLRETHRGPIIAVAGGSGMAPLKSIVERALQKELPQHIYFYFGVRTRARPLPARSFRRAGRDSTNLHFIPVLSEGDGIEPALRAWCTRPWRPTSTSSTAARPTSPARRSWSRRRRRLFEQRGMRRIDIHADAFYTAAEMASAGKKTGAEP